MKFPAPRAFVLALGAGLFLGTAVAPSTRAAPTPRAPDPAEVTVDYVLPSRTDPAISGFDTPHRIYRWADPKQPAPAGRRDELLLWLPGTAPVPDTPQEKSAAATGREGADAFCRLAARLGYRVISLRYPNAASATAARNDDAAEFERFRLAIIAGGTSKHITIARADSIENRLIKLLQHLSSAQPAAGWSQFLGLDGSIRWERIAVAGQSQGGGHAALIARHHRVARVICTGAPKDYNQTLNAPAAWLGAECATPKSRFFALNHRQDRQGATWAQQLENLRTLKLDAFGPPVDVDAEPPPYRHTRILFTNFPGGSLASKAAHTSVISWRNAAVFERVWRYLLTEPVE